MGVGGGWLELVGEEQGHVEHQGGREGRLSKHVRRRAAEAAVLEDSRTPIDGPFSGRSLPPSDLTAGSRLLQCVHQYTHWCHTQQDFSTTLVRKNVFLP